MKTKAYAAWKEITGKEAQLLKKHTDLERDLKNKMVSFAEAAEENRVAKEKELQRARDAEAEKARQAAEKKAASSVRPETVEKWQVAAEEIVAPIVRVESSVPLADGIQYRSITKVDLEDEVAAIKDIFTNHPYLAKVLRVDVPALVKIATSLGWQESPVAGVRVVKTKIISVR